jgi:hypothetical protein
MQTLKVTFQVTCLAEDPMAPSRVMGVFASRGLLPRHFASTVEGSGEVHIEVHLLLESGEYCGPCHLGRVISRLPIVLSTGLWIDGRWTALDLNAETEPG